MNSSAILSISEGDGEERVTPPILHQQAILALHLNCRFLAGEQNSGRSKFHRHKPEGYGSFIA
jgi:hypothetical protein